MTLSEGSNSLKLMVAELEAAGTKFTEFTVHLHYGTISFRRAPHPATLHGKPRRVVINVSNESW
jgi:hypothetical protein